MKKFLLFLIFVSLLTLYSTKSNVFANSPKAEESALFLKSYGLLVGDDGNLMLDQNLTREQMMVLISRLLMSENDAQKFSTTKMTFADVPKEFWAAPYIAWAQSNKITEGYSDQQFGLNDGLTLWQVKAFLVRSLGYTDVSEENIEKFADTLGISTDTKEIPDGIIKRGDMAVLMKNAIYAIGKDGRKIAEKMGIYSADKTSYISIDHWIYYINGNDNNKIYKVKEDGTNNAKLCDDSGSNIGVFNGWIYYINTSDNNSLYRIRTNGTARMNINYDNTKKWSTDTKIICYISSKLNERLYKINLDGTNKIRLTDHRTNDIFIGKDWIYYSDYTNSGRLYKVKLDGTETKEIKINNTIQIINDTVYFIDNKDMSITKKVLEKKPIKLSDGIKATEFKIVGDWVYFLNSDENNILYKIKLDGSNKERIGNYKDISIVEVTNDWVYFLRGSQKLSLYKVKTDGAEESMIIDNVGSRAVVNNDTIYYKNNAVNGQLYSIKTDGTNNQKITDDDGINYTISEGWIYYINLSDAQRIYRISLDGKKREKVADVSALSFITKNDKILYTDINNRTRLYSVQTNTLNKVRLNKESTVIITSDNDWIYCMDINNNEQLFMLQTNGLNRVNLN